MNVDVVVGQARREAGVLSFLTDSERELEVGHDRCRGAIVNGVDNHTGHTRRRQRVGNKARWVVRVIDDVDLFSAEFRHDGAHTRPWH